MITLVLMVMIMVMVVIDLRGATAVSVGHNAQDGRRSALARKQPASDSRLGGNKRSSGCEPRPLRLSAQARAARPRPPARTFRLHRRCAEWRSQ
jgi:hypothetical protein